VMQWLLVGPRRMPLTLWLHVAVSFFLRLQVGVVGRYQGRGGRYQGSGGRYQGSGGRYQGRGGRYQGRGGR
jgi:hypothetical protein